MVTAQPRIFALGTASHAYLELDAAAGAARRDVVTAIASLREPRTTMGGVNLVAGFRPELWRDVMPDDVPGGLAGIVNPSLLEAPGVVLVPDGEPGAGGTVLLLQKWAHDAAAWESTPREEQERVIGRTKLDSVELEDRPEDSHVARTDQEDFGDIFRRNTPYGTITDHGTMFVGFCAAQTPLAAMLDSMAGRTTGVRDALTRFTEPLSGAYYFVPSGEALTRAGATAPG